jgi:hypothetical protein
MSVVHEALYRHPDWTTDLVNRAMAVHPDWMAELVNRAMIFHQDWAAEVAQTAARMDMQTAMTGGWVQKPAPSAAPPLAAAVARLKGGTRRGKKRDEDGDSATAILQAAMNTPGSQPEIVAHLLGRDMDE